MNSEISMFIEKKSIDLYSLIKDDKLNKTELSEKMKLADINVFLKLLACS